MSESVPTNEFGLFQWALDKINSEEDTEALEEVLKYNPDPKLDINLFQLKVTLLINTGQHQDAFDAALLYIGGYDVLSDSPKGLLVTPDVAGVLGMGYAQMKSYEISHKWYEKAALLAKESNDMQMYEVYDACAIDALADYMSPDEAVAETASKQNKQKQKLKQVKQQEISTPLRKTESESSQVIETTPEPPSDEPTIWQFSKLFRILEIVDDRLYQGIMINSVLKRKLTLMEASSEQVDRFEELVSLREGTVKNPHILRVDDIVVGPEKIRFLVCESVTTIDAFFKSKMDIFVAAKGGELTKDDKAGWYKNIESDVNKILHGVLSGLRILFPRGYCCGGLTDNLFVTTTTDWEPRLLPNLRTNASNPSKGQKSDVTELKAKIRHLICLPFKDHVDAKKHHMDAKEYNLSSKLLHLFETLTPSHMGIIPAEWLLFQPLIWNLKERIEFMQNLRIALKRGDIDEGRLDDMLSKHETYWDPKESVPTWQNQIKDPAFIEVFEYPAVTHKFKEYRKPVDIQRYINALHGHLNDGRREDKKFSDIQVDEGISQTFPEVYTDLHRCLIESTKEQKRQGKGFVDNLMVLSNRFQPSK